MPPQLDEGLARRRFARAAAGFDRAAVLHREVARRMAQRLDYVRIEPRCVLDLGCGTGVDLQDLGERYPEALRIGCDLTPEMLGVARARTPWLRRALPWLEARAPCWVCGDARRLPLRSGSVGLLWSNMMLHWIADPLPAIREMHRVLEVGGLLTFSALGPDTLRELRQAFAAVDGHAHVHSFMDMHDIGDILVASGFADPVMDMELITLTYAGLQPLAAELRATASGNADARRARGLMGRGAYARLGAALDAQRREGRIAVSFEVVYGHAWKAQARRTAEGHAVVGVETLRRRR